MILENDCPYQAQDNGWFSINNVRNVYVDQFNLCEDDRNKILEKLNNYTVSCKWYIHDIQHFELV